MTAKSIALGEVLQHSLGRSDWHTQSEGISKSVEISAGSDRLALEKCAVTIAKLTHLESQKV